MGSISNPGARVRDRISELPDSLITHILSFLNDTRLAVTTSVLSKRWEKQWTHVPNLSFDFEDYPTGIDHVLLFRSPSNIQKFTLCLLEEESPTDTDLDFTRIDGWIRTAISCNVVELDLWVELSCLERNMELPQSLFTCKTLKVLKLHSNFIANPPTTGCFPSLKVLFVGFPSDHKDNLVLENIFSNCPVLEELTIWADLRHFRACDINVSAPELKMLDMILNLDEDYDSENEEDLDDYYFYINAPKLANFNLLSNHFSAFIFEFNANDLFKANVTLYFSKEEYHSGILDAISSVKHLSLSCNYVCEVLPNFGNHIHSELGEVLPDFDNLIHLELRAHDNMNYWALLIEFLKKSPNLEDLVSKPYYSNNHPHDEFNPPDFVPVCMLSHLKTITFDYFKGSRDEIAVAKYLLKYCEVLKEMTISLPYKCFSDADKEALCNEILMFEKGSKPCQVKIN